MQYLPKRFMEDEKLGHVLRAGNAGEIIEQDIRNIRMEFDKVDVGRQNLSFLICIVGNIAGNGIFSEICHFIVLKARFPNTR